MYRKLLFGILALALISVLIAACGIKEQLAEAKTKVGMGATEFVETEVTIKKGDFITITNDTPALHIIANGIWDGTTAKPGAEASAPKVNFSLTGKEAKKTIGPFSTAGTFKLYCTIHPKMNLIIKVE